MHGPPSIVVLEVCSTHSHPDPEIGFDVTTFPTSRPIRFPSRGGRHKNCERPLSHVPCRR